jgi:hypothetical protein
MDQLIRNRREEEDEELMLFLFPALYLISNRGREKRARHASILSGKERLNEILEGHEIVLSHSVWSLVYSKI